VFAFSIGIVPVLAEQIFKDIDAKKNAGIEFEVLIMQIILGKFNLN
jgi:hypothetical protein